MTSPTDLGEFARRYDAGAAQLVWTRLIDDLETPVSAYLKIAHGRPYAFLFESVEGGAWRGRYSIIAMQPDLVWRCRGDQAEIAKGDDIAAGRFTPQAGGALDSLRDLVAASRIDLPAGLPPMAAGLFGVIGYDMIRLVERLPDINPDPLDLPDAVMIRPSIVAIFDAIAQEIILVTTVRPDHAPAQAAYQAAAGAWRRSSPTWPGPCPDRKREAPPRHRSFASPVSREAYGEIVERAKNYIRAGDIFQVVPSHRFRAPFAQRPVRPLPVAAADQPLALPVLPELRRLPAGRLLARRSWCGCATARSPSARSPAPGRAARRRPRTWRWSRSCSPTPRSAPST